MKNKLLAFCLLLLSGPAFAIRIELLDVSIQDFVVETAEYLAFPVTVSSDVEQRFSVIINSPGDVRFQKTFESVLESQGLALVKVGEVYSVQAPEPDVPIAQTVVFKHALATDLAPALDELLKGTKTDYAVVALPGHNALVVSMLPKLKALVNQFAKSADVEKRQVYIEAVVFESSARGLQRLGFDLETDGKTGIDITSGLTASGTVGYKVALGQLALNFDAVDSTTDVKVLSTPSIVVADGATGNINIGQEVPVVTGSVRQDDGQAYQSIERRPVGMTLSVVPQLAGDQIMLRVQQEVSSIDPDTEATDVVFNRRSISSVFKVKDGEGVYLGGLIVDSEQSARKGIPGLRWLPFMAFDEAEQDNTVYSVVVRARQLPALTEQ